MEIVEAIKRTTEYANKFGMDLDKRQLWQRLMGPKIFSKKEFEKGLGKFMIVKENKRNTEVVRKLLIAEKMARVVIKNNGDILMMAVTGSVAAENCKKNDDIDILIVTKSNRLWQSRLKLLLFLIKNRYKFRVYGKKERKDHFCFNMWLEEESLKIPQKKQNEKNAVDLILLKVLSDKNKVYGKFLKENNWVKKWVATGYAQKLKVYKVAETIKPNRTRKNTIGDLINLVAFVGQFIYMFPKVTKETIQLKRAFFHTS